MRILNFSNIFTWRAAADGHSNLLFHGIFIAIVSVHLISVNNQMQQQQKFVITKCERSPVTRNAQVANCSNPRETFGEDQSIFCSSHLACVGEFWHHLIAYHLSCSQLEHFPIFSRCFPYFRVVSHIFASQTALALIQIEYSSQIAILLKGKDKVSLIVYPLGSFPCNCPLDPDGAFRNLSIPQLQG